MLLKANIHNNFYDAYSSSNPPSLQPLNARESQIFYELLRLADAANPDLHIHVQGFSERPISEVQKLSFIKGATSARFIPGRPHSEFNSKSLFVSRLTLNFTKEYLPEMIAAFSHLYSGEVADVVRQSKIMGPSNFSSVTDQAIIYIEGKNIKNADRVIEFLAKRVPEQAWVDHTPLGMVSLAKGRNYSESSRFSFSSHGASRSVVAADAILENLFGGESLAILLPETLSSHGYDPARIPLVDSSFDYQSVQMKSHVATTNFIRDPEGFLKSHTLDVTPIIGEYSPLKGKPEMHSGTDGFQLAFEIDGQFRSNKLRVISEPLMDNMPSFIDIAKSGKVGQSLVAASHSGGTIVVVDLDSANYRIYFDKRPHAYALYDDVVAFRDLSSGYRVEGMTKFHTGLDVTFFVFNKQGWQTVVQKQSYSGFSDLDVRRIASTTAVPFMRTGKNLPGLFEQNRASLQKELLLLAKRFGLPTEQVIDLPYDPLELKVLETHSSLKKWNELRTQLNKKISAQRKSLARQRIAELARLKLASDSNNVQSLKKISLLRASLLELDNYAQSLIDLSSQIDQVWLNLKQKSESGTRNLIVTDNSLRSGNFDKGQIHQRFLLKEKTLKELSGSEKAEYESGYNNFETIWLPDYDESMTLAQKQLLLLGSNELDAQQQGALIRRINNQITKDEVTSSLDFTAKFNQEMSRLGGRVVASLPQDFLLTLMGDGSGRCYPLVRAMSVAMFKGTDSIRNLSNKLFVGAANPNDVESHFLLRALRNLHSNNEARESSQLVGQLDIAGIIASVKRGLSERGQVSLAVNTSTHSVGVAAINDMGQKRFYFYDPNFAVVEFSSMKSLKKALESHFVINGMAESYFASGTKTKPEFTVLAIDTGEMSLVEVLPGQQVFDVSSSDPLSPVGSGGSIVTLSDDESFITVEDSDSIMTIDDDESIIVLESSENNIEEDLSLRMSLTKVKAYEQARRLASAVELGRSQYRLPDDWLPVIGSIEEASPGYSAITFVSPDGSAEKTVQVQGRELIEVSEYLHEQYANVNSHFDLRTGQRASTFEFEDVQGFDGLNAGFAVQSVITWFQNEQRSQVSGEKSSALQKALEIHSYVMAGQISHGLLADAQHMVNLFKVAVATDAELVSATMNNISGIANQGIGLAFGAINVSLSAYELAHAQNVQQQAIFGTQLGFNAVGTALGGVALGASITGASTTALVLGEAGAIVGGLAVGFTALAEAFGEIAMDAQQVGRYFYQVDHAYREGGYRYDAEKSVLLPIPGAVINQIDLSNGRVELGSQDLYSSRHGKTGSGWLNYFFWAGDLPKALRDKSKALPLRERLGYGSSAGVESHSSTLVLPATGKSYIDYDYEILPGSTTMNDRGFSILRSLETALDFDFDFYVFPSEYVIRNVREKFVPHTVFVKLGSTDRVVVTPEIKELGLRKLTYHLSAEDGKQEVIAQPYAKFELSEDSAASVEWVIDTRAIEGGIPELKGQVLKIGTVTADLSSLTESRVKVFTSQGEIWQVEDAMLSLIATDAQKEQSSVHVLEHLEALAEKHQLLGDYVVINNYEESGIPLGTAYYDIKNDRVIASKDISVELSQRAQLLKTNGDEAWLFNQQYGLLWKVDSVSGKVTAIYTLFQPSKPSISVSYNAWTEANIVHVAATYHMPDQSQIKHLYRLTEDGLMLTDIHGNERLYQALMAPVDSDHRQLISKSIVQRAYAPLDLTAYENIPTRLADIVEVAVAGATPVWSIDGQEKALILRTLSSVEDLKLLLVDDGVEYFYSEREHTIYLRKEGRIQNVKLKEGDRVTARDHVYVASDNGEIYALTSQGTLSLIAINQQWIERYQHNWQDTLVTKFEGVNHQIMIFGLSDFDGKALKAWYLPSSEQFVLVGGQWSDRQLKVVGKKDGQSVWLFEPITGKLYAQPSFSLEQMYSFTSDLRFIADGLLTVPTEVDLVDDRLADVYMSHDGYRAETGNGLVFEFKTDDSPILVEVSEHWLDENPGMLATLSERFETGPVIHLGKESDHWLVAETGKEIRLGNPGKAIWIGSVEGEDVHQVFFLPESNELLESNEQQVSTSLGRYQDVFRTGDDWSLVMEPTSGELIEVVKLEEADSVVLSTSGRHNGYDINNTIGRYKHVIINDNSYDSFVDLSDFDRDQIVLQHEGDRLKLVIANSTYVVIEEAERASKSKLAFRFAGGAQPVRLIYIISQLDSRSINGIVELSDLDL
ncbi:TcdA/TcdB pore-forming domain-containing protein [Vibrio sp. AND4]|uniref:TcdA/TcdB pore-forming domain-containing protein n=1 Tax=Vibrio sp. AND4 TaxID=314289 RepID=UPI00015EFC4C|nr:TcdA/TcdB pore-forming domain-containing protein [Vibrio sp. AND4]EDP60161.1 DNA ligase [Vibrio sp. AND4]